MNIAALDLGSNSFLLTIARLEENKFQVLHDECVITRLGQGVDESGELHPEALHRAESCFEEFALTMKRFEVEKIKATATSAARDAANSSTLLSLGKKHGIPIEIISGQKEAELTYKGAIVELEGVAEPLVVDIGGGSTEYIVSVDKSILSKSLDIGSVRLTEKFVSKHPVSESEIVAMSSYIRGQLEVLPKKIQSGHVIAVAGTPTTLASLIEAKDFNVTGMHGKKISQNELEQWLMKLKDLNVMERLQLRGMQEGRADVIVAGLTILNESLRYFEIENFTVSSTGVRYGVLQELCDAN